MVALAFSYPRAVATTFIPTPPQTFAAAQSSSVWWVGATSTDSSALPNAGVKSVFRVISYPVTGCLAFWVADDLQNNMWGQVGYYICDSSSPMSFYQVWNLTANSVVGGGGGPVTPGSHTFSMYLQSGTTWAYALDGTLMGTYNMKSAVSSSTYPVYALSEEEGSSTFGFPAVTFSSAMEAFASGSWHNVQLGKSYGTAWGVQGERQNSTLAADEIVVGGSLAPLAAGSILWNTGTSSSTSTATSTMPPPTSTVTTTVTSTATSTLAPPTSTVTSTVTNTATSTVTSSHTVTQTSTVTATRTLTGTTTTVTSTEPPVTSTTTKTSTVTSASGYTTTSTVTSMSTTTLTTGQVTTSTFTTSVTVTGPTSTISYTQTETMTETRTATNTQTQTSTVTLPPSTSTQTVTKTMTEQPTTSTITTTLAGTTNTVTSTTTRTVTNTASSSNGPLNANEVVSTTTSHLPGTSTGQAAGQLPAKDQSAFPLLSNPLLSFMAFLAAGVGVATLVVGKTRIVNTKYVKSRRPRRS